jgi:hypothetical protein
MSRLAVLVAALVAFPSPVAAADPPAGSWKLTLRVNNRPVMMLLAFSQAEGKWVGDIVDSTAQFNADPKFDSVTVAGDTLKFSMSVEKQPFASFDGLIAKDGKKISGSLSFAGGPLELTDLKPSALKKFTDPFEVMRETMDQSEDAQTVYDAALVVLGQAAAKKLKPEDARGIVDRATKLAAGYGPRWERTASLKFANVLADQTGFEDVALAQARKAERLLADDDDATVRLEVLESLVRTLTRAKKPDDAKKYEVQVQRLEARDYQEYTKTVPPFKVEEYKGRKAKSDRVALVEIVTTTELTQTTAFDYARDALLKAYKPTEVIVLTYQLGIPDAPNVLTNRAVQERLQFYQTAIGRNVFSFVNGKRAVQLQKDTTAAAAKAIFDALKEKVNEELEKPSEAKLKLVVTPGEKGFTGKASVTDLEKAGEQTFLRFAVVEEKIRYTAGNGVKYHHNVVRATPGGKGIVLKQKAADHTVTVNPDELRETLSKSLDDLAKEAELPRGERPLALKNLKLVAFVQNDSTGDVLAAAQADLAAAK